MTNTTRAAVGGPDPKESRVAVLAGTLGELADLYDRGHLMTTRLSDRARTRYEQALWYAWGREDAGDARTRGELAGHYLGDAFAFATFAALEAESFERGHRYMLHNIGDQFARFVDAIGADA
jgi:hypothetical protein